LIPYLRVLHRLVLTSLPFFRPLSRAAVTFPAGGDHLRLARIWLAAARNISDGGGGGKFG